jgi:hypothetical protein
MDDDDDDDGNNKEDETHLKICTVSFQNGDTGNISRK